MADIRNLSKAPIREAVIDIQVESSSTLGNLESIEALLTHMPHRKETVWQAAVGFEIDENGPKNTLHDRTPVGFRFIFENSFVLLCRDKGFTLSQLPPYQDWETLSDKAKELWEIYRGVVQPQGITRLAVRYINNFELGLPIQDFGEYFTNPPVVPEGLPQTLASFLQRSVIVNSENQLVAVVTQALEEAYPQASKISFVFDIDTFKMCPIQNLTNDEIWEVLERLRIFKNEVFFGYLTDKTIGMFE